MLMKILAGALLSSNLLQLIAHDYCAVFVHIGNDIPPYTITALEQFRLFNPSCPVYLIAQKEYISKIVPQLEAHRVQPVAAETLSKTPAHLRFLRTSRLDSNWAKGFWRYTTERFFYLEELAIQQNLNCMFHLENDVMVYRNLEELLPTLRKHYRGIAMTFGWDHVAVAGFMYIPSLQALQGLTTYLADHAHQGKNDGELIAQLKDQRGQHCIDYLPAIFPEYAQKHQLINAEGVRARTPSRFYQFSSEFPGIFDAGALGQYLGGISPLNGSLPAGYVNTHCIFNVQRLSFVWHTDTAGRKVPYAKFSDVEYRINNLHVHSKQLEGFRS